MQIINKFLKFKKIYIIFISHVLIIIFFSTSNLHANTFKVSDIEISSPFELNFSKNNVIDDGFVESFINLITMITTSGDRGKLDKTSLKEIKSLIDSFTISDEKFIENEYYAKLEVSFNKKNTLIFLEKKNIFPSIPLRNKVLLIPILVDTEINKVYLFAQNIFHKRWNDSIKNYHLLEYLLPSEDIEDIENVQKNLTNIEDYDFKSLIRKYDLEDYIISIMFKNKNNQLKVLSKINLNNSLKLDNQEFENINFQEQENLYEILNNLKIVYENYWKTNNAINTSIKLPITISIGSRKYKKIQKLEKAMSSIDLISSFNILKFNNQNIFYRIIYNGSPKTFLNDMKKNDLIVEMEKNIWIIK